MTSPSRTAGPCFLFPTDFEGPAKRAFSYALTLAKAHEARLDILHVIKTPTDSARPPTAGT
jgi:nucleotide-binding universal stress UspA family protein